MHSKCFDGQAEHSRRYVECCFALQVYRELQVQQVLPRALEVHMSLRVQQVLLRRALQVYQAFEAQQRAPSTQSSPRTPNSPSATTTSAPCSDVAPCAHVTAHKGSSSSARSAAPRALQLQPALKQPHQEGIHRDYQVLKYTGTQVFDECAEHSKCSTGAP